MWPVSTRSNVPGLTRIEHAWEMAEQHAEIGVTREQVGIDLRQTANDQPRVRARDPDAPAAQLEQHALVVQEGHRREVA